MNDHPDQTLSCKIIDGIKRGVRIGYELVPVSQSSPNWPSASEYYEDVSDFINTNLQLGRVVGPWTTPPCDPFICSPLGAFMRNNKVRTITDLSWPPGHSVNDGIPADKYSVTYATVDQAAEMCLQYGEDCHVAKTDVQKAYTHIMVSPEDWHKLGFCWNNLYYAWAILPFGLRSSCHIYDWFAQGLKHMAIKNGCVHSIAHYLDDNFIVANNYQKCKESLDIFIDTAEKSGFAIQHEKCQGPAKRLEFLGIMIDLNDHTLSISEERMNDIKTELIAWQGKKVCTKRQLLSLIGKLAFSAKVIRSGRTFLRRLIDLSKSVKYLHYKIKLNVQARKDMEWWLKCIDTHNGITLFPQDWSDASVLELWTDASNAAAAAVFENDWFVIPFVGDSKWMVEKPIHWRELYAVVKCIKTFARRLANRRIVLHVDNQVACHSINNGTCKCPDMMELIRSMYYVLAQYGIECRAMYIPSEQNTRADALSRLDYRGFRGDHENANVHMSCPEDIDYYGVLI